jgi:hypothetical protein
VTLRRRGDPETILGRASVEVLAQVDVPAP